MLPSRNTEVSPPPQNCVAYESPFASTTAADRWQGNSAPQRASQRQPSAQSRLEQGQRPIERNPNPFSETSHPRLNDQPHANLASLYHQPRNPAPRREAPVAFEIPALVDPMARESQASARAPAPQRTASYSSSYVHQSNQQSYEPGPHSRVLPFQFGNPQGIEATRPTDEYQQSASDQRNQPSTRRRRRVRSSSRQPDSDLQADSGLRRPEQVQSHRSNQQANRPVFPTGQHVYPNGSVRSIVAERPDMSEEDRALILALLNEDTRSSSNPNPPQHFRYPNPNISSMSALHNMMQPVFPDAYSPYNPSYNRVAHPGDEDDDDGGRLLDFGAGITRYHAQTHNPIIPHHILGPRYQPLSHRIPQSQIPEGASYEELLQLDEKNVEAGLPKARRNGFEIRTISKQCELECSICLCNYEAGDKVMSLFCSHEFHAKCINDWFDKKPICPVCRFDYMEA